MIQSNGAGRRSLSSKRLLCRAIVATPAVAALLALLPTARAANQYWDLNGLTTGATDDGGGIADGTWDNSTANWNLTSTGITTATAVFVAGNQAVFSAGTNAIGASTITVSGAQTTAGMTFEEGTLTFNGAQINLTAATLATTANTTINNVIGGTAGLTKTGAGTLVLNGNNVYSGTTTVTTGVLTMTGSNTLTNATTVNAATLNLDYTTNNTNKINPTGLLTLGNLSTLNVNGFVGAGSNTSQSVSGLTLSANGLATLNVNAGDVQSTTLALGAVARGAASVLKITTTSLGGGVNLTTTSTGTNGILGGYAVINNNDWAGVSGGNIAALASYDPDDFSAATKNTTVTGDVTPASGIAINSLRFNAAAPATVTLSGTNTLTTGGILVTPNVSGNAANITGGNITSATSDVVVIQNNINAEFTVSSVITGTVGLTKGGPGTLIISGDNTATGLHNIAAGTLKLGAADRIANTAALNVNTNATFDMNGFNETVGSLAGGGAIALSSTLTTGGLNTSTTYSGPADGIGKIIKVGSGTLTLSGTSGFTGGIDVTAGVVAVSSANGLGGGGGAIEVTAGAALQVTGAVSMASHTVTIRGTGISNAGALRKTAANSTTFTGGVQYATDGARVNADANTLILTGGQSGSGGNRDIQFGGAGNISVSGIIASTINTVSKDGAGTLTLSGNNVFTGGMIITGGVVSHNGEGSGVGGANSTSGTIPIGVVPDYIQLSGGATFRSTRVGLGVTFLATNKGITLGTGGGVLAVTDVTAGNLNIYSGVITGTGPLGFSGPGVLSLTATQTYTGATNVTGGILRLRTGPGQIPSGSALTITSPGAFDVAAFSQTVGSLAGSGNLVANTSTTGSFTFGGDNTNTVFSGQVASTSLAATNLPVTKNGTGTLTIQANNWLNTGTTTISAGTIKYGTSNAGLGDSAPISIATAGTLDMDSLGVDVIGSLTGSGKITNLGSLTTGGLGTSTTFSGAISGGVASSTLIKVGAGTFRLSGSNSYSGTTAINGGILQATATGNLGSATNTLAFDGGTLQALGPINGNARSVTLNAGGGIIDTNTFAVTVGNIDGAGTLTKNSAGVLTASHVRSGALSVAGGSLAIAPDGGAGGVSVVASTTIAPGSKWDISNNHIVDKSTGVGTWTGSAYTAMTGLIASGRNGGGWGGSGIVTSQSTAATGNFTSIGIATASQVKGVAATSTATWAGQTVTGSDSLVMYTYGGDANLDGKINVDDYTRIDFNVPLGTNGWYNGDFNYDGKINVDDYTIIDFNVGIQGAPLFSAAGGSSGLAGGLLGVTAVPEPASLSVLGLAAGMLVGRRRRR